MAATYRSLTLGEDPETLCWANRRARTTLTRGIVRRPVSPLPGSAGARRNAKRCRLPVEQGLLISAARQNRSGRDTLSQRSLKRMLLETLG